MLKLTTLALVLYGAGCWLVCLAAWFSLQQVEDVVCTDRMCTDLVGDIQAWLRNGS